MPYKVAHAFFMYVNISVQSLVTFQLSPFYSPLSFMYMLMFLLIRVFHSQ